MPHNVELEHFEGLRQRAGKWTQIVQYTFFTLMGLTLVLSALWWSHGEQQPGVLEASSRFVLESPQPGVYRWALHSGPASTGTALRMQEERIASRGDQLQYTLLIEAEDGTPVQEGAPLAQLTSAQLQQQLAEISGDLESLQARRTLLEAGSRDAEVSEARQAVRVAAAKVERAAVELARIETLASQGAAGVAERQQAEQELQIRNAALSLARTQVSVAEAPARPEAIAEIDANLNALTMQLSVLEETIGDTIFSPMSGALVLHAGPTLLEVVSRDVLVRFPVTPVQRSSVSTGMSIAFQPTGTWGADLDGEVVSVGSVPQLHAGASVFWAFARLQTDGEVLLPGLTGTVHLPLESWP